MKEFKGNCFEIRTGVYKKIMFPFVRLKVFFVRVYHKLLKIIWSELIEGKKVEDEITNLILFIIFSLFCLISYYLQNYVEFILITFIIIWYIDYIIALNQSTYLPEKLSISLKQSENSELIYYQMVLSQQKQTIKLQFNATEIKQIYLIATEVKGGAFEEKMGLIWQSFIILYNEQILLIDERKTPHEIFNRSQDFQELFNLNIPIIFKDSEGNNPYTETKIKRELTRPDPTIKAQLNRQIYHIYSQWSWGNSWYLFKQIFQEIGFFIFLVIMANFMVKFGSWVSFFLGNYLGWTIPVLRIYNLGEWFNPQLNTFDFIALAIAVFLMIVKGGKLSQEKHFYLDQNTFKFLINNRKICQFKVTEIKTILILNKPELSLLIITGDESVQVTQLQQKAQFISLLLKLEEALNLRSIN